ncbi:hypothetical protein LB515_13555 [Mesorhizobium sp. CA15]|uniref:hypothetical protein n=1 Tax=Mesorhizobium sp. CA15 TaxID=2876641 RepID=UPI001CD133A4|nr:hypothetical protein [Mesorhizobium sp. CA15]MBZ9866407.1 hypothetical protein [Mesorhizobium sp. CA15]
MASIFGNLLKHWRAVQSSRLYARRQMQPELAPAHLSLAVAALMPGLELPWAAPTG